MPSSNVPVKWRSLYDHPDSLPHFFPASFIITFLSNAATSCFCLRHQLHLTRTAKLVCFSEVGLILFQPITVWDLAFLEKKKKTLLKVSQKWTRIQTWSITQPESRHVHSPNNTLCPVTAAYVGSILVFEQIFTCWSSNAAFLLSSCLFGMFQTQIFLLCAWHFMMYSVFCPLAFSLNFAQIPYFSFPSTLTCVAQSLLVPGKILSKYGRRGSAIGIETIEEVDIYPFHITNVIFTVIIWYGIVIILLHLFIVVGASLSIYSLFSYLYKERIINLKINNRLLEKLGKGCKIDSYTSLCLIA